MKIFYRFLILLTLLIPLSISKAQTGPIYLPIILSDGKQVMEYAILAISNGEDTVNFLDYASGIQIRDPYWTPQVAQLKGGGTYVNPSNTDGQSLVEAHYDNVIETIPFMITGPNGYKTVERVRRLFNLSVNAQNYHTTSFELDRVYFIVKPKGNNFLTGYSTLYTISLTNLEYPFGTPFTNDIDQSAFTELNLILNREPFFSPLLPGETIGPYHNLVSNSDFLNWSDGIADAFPDQWEESTAVNPLTGTVDRDNDTKFNNGFSVKVTITAGSAVADKIYGIKQSLGNLVADETYTFVAVIKNNGFSNGTAKITISDSAPANFFDLYSSSSSHDWDIFYKVFTEDELSGSLLHIAVRNPVGGAPTLGNFLVDSIMILNGDWSDEIDNNLVHWMSSSNILNSYDADRENVTDEDRINYVDLWNIPGDVLAPMDVTFQNETSPSNIGGSPNGSIHKLVIGEKFNLNQNEFVPVYDLGGITSIDGANNNVLTTSALSENWTEIGGFSNNDVTAAIANNARYKLYLRIRDGSTSPLEGRVRYWIGSPTNLRILPTVSLNNKGIFTSLNLTENDTIDFTNVDASNSNFGYFIDLKRSDEGTDTVEIDYALLVPLDNYIEIDFSPALLNSASININNDNINPASTKSGTDWITEAYLTNAQSESIYNNTIYLSAQTFNGIDDVIISLKNQTVNLEYTGVGGVFAITPIVGPPYQGLLPIFLEDAVGTTSVHLSDGITFPGTKIFDIGEIVKRFVVFNNNLYMVGIVGGLWEWDGAVLTNVGNPVKAPYTIQLKDLIVYKNTLYVEGRDANNYNGIWSVNIGAGTFTNIYEFENAGVPVIDDPAFTIHNDLLYIVDGALSPTATKQNYIYTWDGNTLTLIYSTFDSSLTKLFQGNNVDIISYNGNLFVINDNNASGFQQVAISTDDGVTFSEIRQFSAANFVFRISFIYQGSLYIADDSILRSYSDSNTSIIYNQTDFTGGSFLGKNRNLKNYEYQRLLFKFLRENEEDVLSDAGLVSIGIRPLYFSLINKDDF